MLQPIAVIMPGMNSAPLNVAMKAPIGILCLCILVVDNATCQSYQLDTENYELHSTVRAKAKSRFKVAADLTGGLGKVTRGIRERYKSSLNLGGSIELLYGPIVLDGEAQLAIGRTRQALVRDSVKFNRRQPYGYGLGSASVGAVIHDDQDLRLIPFVGFAWYTVWPRCSLFFCTEDEKLKIEGITFDKSKGIRLGIILDFKASYNVNTDELISMRIKYSANYLYQSPSLKAGIIHTITIGWSGLSAFK